MSREQKKVCTTLKYVKHFLILASAIAGCISVAWYSYRNHELYNGIKKNCAIAAGIKKFKSIIKKKKKKRDNSMEILAGK